MAGQIEKSIMIKLRESESNSAGNGNFTTTLIKSVLLEDGDQVKVHTAILDTSTEGLINISNFDDNGVANGLDLSIDVLRWWRFSWQHRPNIGDPNLEAVMTLDGVNRSTEWGMPDATAVLRPQSEWPTNKRYFPALLKSINGQQDIWPVLGYIVLPKVVVKSKPAGGGNLEFTYVDPVTGQETRGHFTCPTFDSADFSTGYGMKIGINVVGQQPFGEFPDPTSFILTTSVADLNALNLEPPFINRDDKKGHKKVGPEFGPRLNPTEETYIATPFTRTLTFNLPNKRYSPGEVCTYINDRISSLYAAGAAITNPTATPPQTFNVNNAFLGSVKEMAAIMASDYPAGTLLGWFPEVDDINTDATQMLSFNLNILEVDWQQPGGSSGPQDIFIGAEQVDLAYDGVLQKIAFSSLHFPNYVNAAANAGTGEPGIEWSRAPPYGPVAGELIPDYSGAAFTALSPIEFWRDQLGFQNIIIPVQNSKTAFFSNPGNPAGFNPDIPIAQRPTPATAAPPSGFKIQGLNVVATVGLNITSVYQGLDLVVFKSDTFWMPQTPIPAQSWAPGDTGTATSLTTPILADREFNLSANDEGYFLLEVGFKFPQMMVGGSAQGSITGSYNNIQSIVGKYYTSTNNFLQDQGSGTINYQHYGEPQLISDLSVRVLNPDGSIPSTIDLGNRNTLFLEIIKAVNITVAPPPKNPIVPIN